MEPEEKAPAPPLVETQMLIRKPAAEVFAAFIDPSITVNFWFTKSSGPLKEGETVTWEWEMYGVSTDVKVKKIVRDRLIVTEWGNPSATVEYTFTDYGNDTTYVVIRNSGFAQQGEDLIAAIKDNTAGFTSVLDGLKAWLEHGIRLNLVADKFPDKLNSGPRTLNEWQGDM
jgi:uncharacterized protein YndB with AHSA1/START domain